MAHIRVGEAGGGHVMAPRLTTGLPSVVQLRGAAAGCVLILSPLRPNKPLQRQDGSLPHHILFVSTCC